jgi:hypothetical protein
VVLEAPDKALGIKEARLYLWTVPARVAGGWRGTLTGPAGEEPVRLEIEQRFQRVSVLARLRDVAWRGEGRAAGDRIALDLRRAEASDAPSLRLWLRADGDRLEGEAAGPDGRRVLRASRATPLM